MRNVLSKAAVDIPRGSKNIKQLVIQSFEGIDKLYSYILYENYRNQQFNGWHIEFMLSQEDSYNQIAIEDMATEIAELTEFSKKSEHRSILGYRQPNIEVIMHTYEPLMKKLVREQLAHWQHLEYEDLLQTCRLVVMKLYRGGYYIHKHLLRRAFNNEILMSLRKERDKPLVLSFDSVVDNDEKITVGDTIPDVKAIMEEQDMLDASVNDDVIKAKREMIVKQIGQRQYDQLLREYGNKSTTNWSRKTVQTLKLRLQLLGVTDKTFNKYL